MPGFAETWHTTFQPFRKKLEQNGLTGRVHGAEHPKPIEKKERARLMNEVIAEARVWYQNNRPDLDPQTLEAVLLSVPPTIFEKALAVMTEIKKYASPEEALVLFGHSQGAMTQAYVALLWPEYFRNTHGQTHMLFLSNPAGLTGREGFSKKALEASRDVRKTKVNGVAELFGVSFRVAEIMTRDIFTTLRAVASRPLNKAVRNAAGGWLAYLARHFVFGPRIIKEAHDMANTDLIPVLEIIAGNGFLVTVMYDENDPLFPAETIEKRLSGHPSIQLRITERGGHFHPLTKAGESADIVTDAIYGA